MAGRNSKQKRRLREYLLTAQGGLCYYCFKEIDAGLPKGHGDHGTLDHRVPLARGGTNYYTNMVLACWLCNHTKDAMLEDEFRQYMRERQMESV